MLAARASYCWALFPLSFSKRHINVFLQKKSLIFLPSIWPLNRNFRFSRGSYINGGQKVAIFWPPLAVKNDHFYKKVCTFLWKFSGKELKNRRRSNFRQTWRSCRQFFEFVDKIDKFASIYVSYCIKYINRQKVLGNYELEGRYC